jgi:hypothetical protein
MEGKKPRALTLVMNAVTAPSICEIAHGWRHYPARCSCLTLRHNAREQVLDGTDQQLPATGLRQDRITSRVERRAQLPGVLAAHHEDGHILRGGIVAQGATQREAVHARHADVAHDRIWEVGSRFGQSADSVLGEGHGHARPGQESAEQVTDLWGVIDEQDVGRA